MEAGGAQLSPGILSSGSCRNQDGGGQLLSMVVTQVWLFWGPSWKQYSRKAELGRGWVGEETGIGPWRLSPGSPLPVLQKEQGSRGHCRVGTMWPGLCPRPSDPFLYSLGGVPINATEQVPKFPWAENPIGKVTLELLE